VYILPSKWLFSGYKCSHCAFCFSSLMSATQTHYKTYRQGHGGVPTGLRSMTAIRMFLTWCQYRIEMRFWRVTCSTVFHRLKLSCRSTCMRNTTSSSPFTISAVTRAPRPAARRETEWSRWVSQTVTAYTCVFFNYYSKSGSIFLKMWFSMLYWF